MYKSIDRYRYVHVQIDRVSGGGPENISISISIFIIYN